MTNRVRQLAERRSALQARCTVERLAFAAAASHIEARLQPVDRLAAMTRGALAHPVALVAGLVATTILARAGGSRLLVRAVLAWTALGRLRRLLRAL